MLPSAVGWTCSIRAESGGESLNAQRCHEQRRVSTRAVIAYITLTHCSGPALLEGGKEAKADSADGSLFRRGRELELHLDRRGVSLIHRYTIVRGTHGCVRWFSVCPEPAPRRSS